MDYTIHNDFLRQLLAEHNVFPPLTPFAYTPPSLCPPEQEEESPCPPEQEEEKQFIQQWENLKQAHPGFKLPHTPRLHPALVEVVTGPHLMKEVKTRLDQNDPSSTFMASFGITCREAAAMGVGHIFAFHGSNDDSCVSTTLTPTLTHAKVIYQQRHSFVYLGSANALSASRDTGVCAFLPKAACRELAEWFGTTLPEVDEPHDNGMVQCWAAARAWPVHKLICLCGFLKNKTKQKSPLLRRRGCVPSPRRGFLWGWMAWLRTG